MFQTTSQTQYVGCLSEKACTCPTTFKNMKSWPGAANSQTHPQRKKVPKLADTTWWQYPRAHGWHLIPKGWLDAVGSNWICQAGRWDASFDATLIIIAATCPTFFQLVKPGNDVGHTHGRHGCNDICYTQGRAKRILPVTSKKCTEAQAKTASKHLGS